MISTLKPDLEHVYFTGDTEGRSQKYFLNKYGIAPFYRPQATHIFMEITKKAPPTETVLDSSPDWCGDIFEMFP